MRRLAKRKIASLENALIHLNYAVKHKFKTEPSYFGYVVVLKTGFGWNKGVGGVKAISELLLAYVS